MHYRTFLFDLDGTLTDPAEGICQSVIYALQSTGRKTGPIEKYHKYIGPPLIRSFEVYENASPEEAIELLRFYRERFSKVGLFENIPYPGMVELLRDLKAAGAKVAVATGKPTVYATQILEHFGMLPYVDFVSGIPLGNEDREKCECIQHALYTLHETDRDACVMIGDRSHDAVGAKMAHIDFIGVLYGYGSREELEAEGDYALAESVDALRALLFA